MLELPWIHLLESIKPEQISLRVLLHDLPKREGKCLAELHAGHLEGAITEPGKLLDPKIPLSPRQKAAVETFVHATPFSAKRDVYALSPAQAVSFFHLSNEITLEVRGKGYVTHSTTPAVLKGFLEKERLVIKAIGEGGLVLENPTVLGSERTVLLDENLKAYDLEPVFLPNEASAILSAKELSKGFIGRTDSLPVFTQLAKMGVDLACLQELGEKPNSKLTLRALLTRNNELRIHLVNILSLGEQEDEVEVQSKGVFEPVFWFPDGSCVNRPTKKEEQARQAIFALGATPAEKHKGFSAKGQVALNFLSKVSKKGALPSFVHVDPDCLPDLIHLPDKPTLAIESISNGELQVQIKIGEASFSLEKLFEVAKQGGQAVQVGDDEIITFSEGSARTLQLLSESLGINDLSESKNYSFWEMGLLWNMLQSQVEIEAEEGLYKRLSGFVPKLLESDHLLPKGLGTALRPYQHDALAWMSQLHRAGLGRLLADEMGLGKTLQVLSLIALIKDREGQKPCLVVAPTSVLDVWVAESKTHFEGLNAVKWHGSDREFNKEELEKVDIVVTSYSLLRRDIEKLALIEFRYLIIDEAQTIKNSKTEAWKAARSIKSEQRMALSGTPIENRVLDLYSILELVSPGVLGDERSFLKRYGSAERNAELRERVRPMIMRRCKEDVASDLPPKIENILRCEMTPEQRGIYLGVLQSAKQEFNQSSQNSIPLLAALTRLRQVCCDPALLPNQGYKSNSAKLNMFLDIMDERLAAGRKVIVYSQFVKMQRIMIDALAERGIKDTVWLHGGTIDRADVVAKFQDPDGPRVIVVSLKAGGTGITLTAADTVVYYDPWWNPAVMDQAADRAHRIGQTKTVHLIKLICQDSIEEQILALCEHKRALANDLLLADGAGARSLSIEDIRQLLQVEIDRES